MAYKDEYEVARLYTEGSFRRRLERDFEGDVRLTVHLAPPLLARPRPGETEPRKMAFGPWILTAFKALARLKRLRGTPLDPFGYTAERREERRLIRDYEALVDELLAGLTPEKLATAVELASIPDRTRGFGPVKARFLAQAKRRERELLEAFRGRGRPPTGRPVGPTEPTVAAPQPA
jgi:indolepyruvate ferredoxin oxidoreductase